MTQLDEILAQHADADGCPTSREWRRAMGIELRRTAHMVRRGVTLRQRPARAGRRP